MLFVGTLRVILIIFQIVIFSFMTVMQRFMKIVYIFTCVCVVVLGYLNFRRLICKTLS